LMSEDVNIYYSFKSFLFIYFTEIDRINILLCNKSTGNVNIWIIFQHSPMEIDLQIIHVLQILFVLLYYS
jgi:hypothetical protein